ncbi:hypothetical protein AAA799D07_00584 [Marine Group I thaumarchaeote SCGC AAA799-D07]|nr:hypothetical protein AAA799D07_00584 [Marine Group I thaumarchaeote SCGC AAA799-D07]
MTTRTQVLIPITIAAVIVGAVGLMSLPSETKLESVEFPMGTIKVDEIPLQVQIADTEPRRVRGLMFQDQLPYDQGMIFVFEQSGLYSLWMLNMQFPLDMIWFDQDGKVVHIEENVPPCKTALEITTCQSVVPDEEATYILEVTSGFVVQNNITKDSILTIISI